MHIAHILDERARRLRRYEEDGAEVWFSPETGLNVRFENARTRRARRRVPRAVMFGITNRCNLRCDFCSRDVTAESGWSVESAATLLEDLAHEGVLEVAFGGGEPFAFAGFDALLTRLRRTTALALAVTTNGTLITEERWARYTGLLAMVRVSVYPEIAWRDPARVLQDAGQRWGANVLVDDQNVHQLAALLDDLAAAGAHDVSLLSYVGVPSRVLTIGARRRLAQIIERAPLPCRLSVCMGDAVPVHRLWAGATRDGDCGAGVDFVSITPDGTMAPCSFHQARFRVQNAHDVLATYWLQRMALMSPSSRSGCARASFAPTPEIARPSIAVWHAFSGNNSGECVLAAKFSEEADAESFLAALLPTWTPDEDYPQAWRELFEAERIAVPEYPEAGISPRGSPEELGRIGPMVIAVGGGLDDVFPELRALALRKQAKVLPGGIHVHGTATLMIGVRTDDAARLVEIGMRAGFEPLRHGALAFFTHPLGELSEVAAKVRDLVRGDKLAVEVVMHEVSREALVAAAKHLGSPYVWQPRTVVSFSEWPAPNKALAKTIAEFLRFLGDERHERAGSQFWFDAYRGTRRVALAAMRLGAYVETFDGEALRIYARAFHGYQRKPSPAIAACAREIRAAAPRDARVTEMPREVSVSLVSKTPAQTLRPFAEIAHAHALGFAVHVEENDAVLTALRRLREELL